VGDLQDAELTAKWRQAPPAKEISQPQHFKTKNSKPTWQSITAQIAKLERERKRPPELAGFRFLEEEHNRKPRHSDDQREEESMRCRVNHHRQHLSAKSTAHEKASKSRIHRNLQKTPPGEPPYFSLLGGTRPFSRI
jgi:hypothetical protein